jgi:peptidoglycan/LPS O-acetylase OafA/YrhL
MWKIVDLALGGLLLLGGVLHAFGSLRAYPSLAPELVWALSGSLAAILLGVLNIVRANRPRDRPLAWITLLGTLCWVAVALAFGAAINNAWDLRVLYHALVATALTALSLRTVLGRSAEP